MVEEKTSKEKIKKRVLSRYVSSLHMNDIYKSPIVQDPIISSRPLYESVYPIVCPRDLEWVIDAHLNCSKKERSNTRKWDRKTPYYVHPIWCATTFSTETTINPYVKMAGSQALLFHDVLEDTTKGLPKYLDRTVLEIIQDMTFEGGSEQEMEEIWEKDSFIKLLKLYDKVSNLLDGKWMGKEKREIYEKYTELLCRDVTFNYGELNILRIAESIIKGDRK